MEVAILTIIVGALGFGLIASLSLVALALWGLHKVEGCAWTSYEPDEYDCD